MFTIGLKFGRTDNLDKPFESFAVDPEKTVAPKEEISRFSKPQPQNEKKKDRKQEQAKPKKRPTSQTPTREFDQ